MLWAPAAAAATIRDRHRVVCHADHPLHLKHGCDLTLLGPGPQLCSPAAAVPRLGCAAASAAGKPLHAHSAQLQNVRI